MQVQPYLFFDGRCEEAMEFYRAALGAQVDMMFKFKDSPDPQMVPPGSGDKVMHTTFRIGETTLMASDGECNGKAAFKGFSLSISVPTIPEAEQLFARLADGGQVQQPLVEAFFAPRFGMVADRFGVSWMVVVGPTPPPK